MQIKQFNFFKFCWSIEGLQRLKVLALTLFYYVSQEIWLGIQKSLLAETNQDSTFSSTCKNSKMFNITSKYFFFFNNKPPASWVAHIIRDFLICYSCSYYCSMLEVGQTRIVQVSNQTCCNQILNFVRHNVILKQLASY